METRAIDAGITGPNDFADAQWSPRTSLTEPTGARKLRQPPASSATLV